MKQLRSTFVLFLSFSLAIVLASCAFSSSYGVQAIGSLAGVTAVDETWSPGPGGCERDLQGILETLENGYPYFEDKGISFASLQAEFMDRLDGIEKPVPPGEFAALLLELFARLGNGHTNLFNIKWTQADMRAVYVSGRVFIEHNGNGSVPSRGDEILEIDGMAVDAWLAARQVDASTPQWRRFKATQEIFKRWFFEPAMRSFRLLRPDGSSYEIEVELNRTRDTFHQIVVDDRALGTSAYIALNSMELGSEDIFIQRLEKYVDYPALILDLRGNSGGASQTGTRILSHLIQKVHSHVLGGTWVWPSSDVNFKGRIALLIGPATFSAAESFACDLQRSGRVVSIGTATAGDFGGGPRFFLTEGGICFRMATNGNMTISGVDGEGAGLLPDIELEGSAQDWLAGRDIVLERAQEELD